MVSKCPHTSTERSQIDGQVHCTACHEEIKMTTSRTVLSTLLRLMLMRLSEERNIQLQDMYDSVCDIKEDIEESVRKNGKKITLRAR